MKWVVDVLVKPSECDVWDGALKLFKSVEAKNEQEAEAKAIDAVMSDLRRYDYELDFLAFAEVVQA